MASIVIAGSGTLGDHLPLVGLGRALAERGHRVRLAFNPAMRGYAERAGLGVVPFGPRLDPTQARRHAAAFDNWTAPPIRRRWTTRSDRRLVQACEALMAACRQADLLIAPINDRAGPLVHERLGIPWVTAAVMPGAFVGPLPTLDDAVAPDEEAYLRSFAEHLLRVRGRLGLPDRPLAGFLDGMVSPRTLLASSRAFSGPLASHYGHVRTTGFWFYDDPAWADWRPGSRLSRFVEAEPPLVLAFGSMPLVNPAAVLAVHARAAVLLGRRLIVQRGWAGFARRDLPPDVPAEDVLFVGALPHDWLLARAAALMLPGGIGLLARALRAGCPMVIEPYGNDGFFNARHVAALGLGVALHPYRLTPASLANVLVGKVLRPECRQRVEALGAIVRAEDGLRLACDLIEGWLRADPEESSPRAAGVPG